jgi:hypothetical protein
MTISKIIDNWDELKQNNVKDELYNLVVFVFTVSFLFGSATGLFPVNIGRTNILVHYVGYWFGVLVPLLFVDGGMLVLKAIRSG